MKELSVEAVVDNLERVTDFVNGELETVNCPVRVQTQIAVAVDELFGNIVRYAYHPATGMATVEVELKENPPAVEITFIDSGIPYDPLKNPDPDITLSAEEREIGGLGIYLVKRSMDAVTYEYTNGRNILKIRKNL